MLFRLQNALSLPEDNQFDGGRIHTGAASGNIGLI